jgi:hypothetical protein
VRACVEELAISNSCCGLLMLGAWLLGCWAAGVLAPNLSALRANQLGCPPPAADTFVRAPPPHAPPPHSLGRAPALAATPTPCTVTMGKRRALPLGLSRRVWNQSAAIVARLLRADGRGLHLTRSL